MAKKYKSRSSRRRCKKGGMFDKPLGFATYPGTPSSPWAATIPGGIQGASAAYKSFQAGYASDDNAANRANLNAFALTGRGQGSSAQSGGGRSKRNGRKHGRKSSKKVSAKSLDASSHVLSREQEMAQGLREGQAQAQQMAMRQAQSQGLAQKQTGGMFASFGALLKEALVPLGLLAAQQTYGKTYGRKHKSTGSHTRKHRK